MKYSMHKIESDTTTKIDATRDLKRSICSDQLHKPLPKSDRLNKHLRLRFLHG